MELKNLFQQNFFEESISKVVEIVKKNEKGLNKLLDPKIESLSGQNREIIISYELNDWQTNTVGNLHGGMMASICDLSMSIMAQHMCYNLGGIFSPTTSLNMTYLNSIKKEDKIYVKVKLMSEGKSLINVRAEIYVNSEKNPYVLSNGTYKIVRKK